MREFVEELLNWLGIEDSPKKSDVIFLFGSTSLDVPKKGFELWKEKYAKVIVCNGLDTKDPEWKWKKPCAEVYADYLFKKGVPRGDVYIQNKSKNTLEDVLQGTNLLKKRKIKSKSMILVSRSFHQRRAFATFKKHFPNIKIYNCPAGNRLLLKMSRQDLDELFQKCLDEYGKLIKYAEKGDLGKQEIPEKIRNIFIKHTSLRD